MAKENYLVCTDLENSGALETEPRPVEVLGRALIVAVKRGVRPA